ncbi:uncharacterized protein DS421_17g579810 [Arachis hypogaea]|nr:uncharacterized protein DS421_17g579810 [Arachis hypogaea]
MPLCLSDITRIPSCGVTCLLRFERKYDQDSAFSPSTSANATGKIFELPS